MLEPTSQNRTESRATTPLLGGPNRVKQEETKSKFKSILQNTAGVLFFGAYAVGSAVAGAKILEETHIINAEENHPIKIAESTALGVAIVALPKIVVDYLLLLMRNPEKSRFVTHILVNAGLAVAAGVVGHELLSTDMDREHVIGATAVGAGLAGLAIGAIAENVLPASWRP